MTALVRYDAMCRAIDAAYEVDEVKEFRDQGNGDPRLTARQQQEPRSRNGAPARSACAPSARPGNPRHDGESEGGPDRDGSRQRSQRTTSERAALSDLGISKDQSSRWQKLAAVPKDEFEAALAGPDKPSTTGIIEEGQPNGGRWTGKLFGFGAGSWTSSAMACWHQTPTICCRK